MNYIKTITRLLLAVVIPSTALTACSDDNDSTPLYPVNITSDVPADYLINSQEIHFNEINTNATITASSTADIKLPAGTYNIDATAQATLNNEEKSLRAVQNNVVVASTGTNITLKWFPFNPNNSFVFGELFISGTLNAKGTNGLYDAYITIYNNTDEVLYADGLALLESKLVNSTAVTVVTEANKPENNFTTGVVYVIPGKGTDVPVQPGQSLKICDQAINWGAEVEGAMNNLDADFEWYDETTGSVKDTDNPNVPNLDKWYSYSNTIWIISQQCNRSYALARFPEGMTVEKYLADYAGDYDYIGTTGTEMKGTKCYLIPNSWIIDGVNLCVAADWKLSALAPSIDKSYASIAASSKAADRCGKKFVRKQAGMSAAGNVILMDNDDSANDFEVVATH